MAIRVVRIIEYTYKDTEAMEQDMSHWTVQTGTYSFNSKCQMRSATLPLETIFTQDED